MATATAKVIDATPQVDGSYKIDIGRGTTDTSISAEWCSRPHDQKFLNLTDLHKATKEAAEQSYEVTLASDQIVMHATPGDSEKLSVILPGGAIQNAGRATSQEIRMNPTHWTFGQLCRLGEPTPPASYLRELPAFLSAQNLQYSLLQRGADMKFYVRKWRGKETQELRAITGPDYGRVRDHEVVDAVMKIAGNGTGKDGSHWKIPGLFNWSDMHYNPHIEPTLDTTTLYASDRDMHIFLCDDTHPIQIGTLPDGSPDLVFRGFRVWNSEVGCCTLGIATMYLRGSCCNRILWGVENFQQITMRHSKRLPIRFLTEAMPALESYANASDRVLINGVKEARSALVAANTDEAKEFLTTKAGLSKPMALKVLETVTREEGVEARSVWDMVQGITAVARRHPNTDVRLNLEETAGKLLDKVTKSAA